MIGLPSVRCTFLGGERWTAINGPAHTVTQREARALLVNTPRYEENRVQRDHALMPMMTRYVCSETPPAESVFELRPKMIAPPTGMRSRHEECTSRRGKKGAPTGAALRKKTQSESIRPRRAGSGYAVQAGIRPSVADRVGQDPPVMMAPSTEYIRPSLSHGEMR